MSKSKPNAIVLQGIFCMWRLYKGENGSPKVPCTASPSRFTATAAYASAPSSSESQQQEQQQQ